MRKTFFEKCINLHLCRVALVLLLLVPAISSLQAIPSQSKTISGVVTSATDNEPLIGVSVQVKETSTGGITDMDGKYSVTAQTGQTLVFSYIGYKSQEFKVGDSSVINVSLKEDTEMLDEVVVVGYGVQKKKLVTGATVQVKGENIAKLNTTHNSTPDQCRATNGREDYCPDRTYRIHGSVRKPECRYHHQPPVSSIGDPAKDNLQQYAQTCPNTSRRFLSNY